MIEKIGPKAFYQCIALEAVTLPCTVAQIYRGTFGRCLRLKSIIVPPSVKAIRDGAFEQCRSLKSLILPPNLEWFGDHVIHNCKKLWTLCVRSMDNGILGWDREMSAYDFCNLDPHLMLLCNSTKIPNHMEHWQPIMVLHDIAHLCGYLNHAANFDHGMIHELNNEEQIQGLGRVFKSIFQTQQVQLLFIN